METIEPIGDIDGQRWLHPRVLPEIAAGQLRVIVLPHCPRGRGWRRSTGESIAVDSDKIAELDRH